MSELKFTPVNNEEYNTVSINIENAIMEIVGDDYYIFDTHQTKFGYRKANLKINNEGIREKLKSWEEEINEYLKNEVGTGAVTILYGNRIYPKVSSMLGQKDEKHHINIKSIWIDEKNKPFVQLWYVKHTA